MRSELPSLEKAYSQKDLAKQKDPLGEILKQLKPLRLRSIDELDFNTRGRLITTLLRVGRQAAPLGASVPSKPAEGAETAAAATPPPAEEAVAGSEAASNQAAPGEGASAEETTSVPSAPETEPAADVSEPEPAATIEAAMGPAAEVAEPAPATTIEAATGPASEAQSDDAVAIPAVPAASSPPAPVDEKATAFADVMFLVGSIWRAVGDERRAALAFAASGRKADQQQAVQAMHRSGDWREEAQLLESQKRHRDAARLHERHQEFGEAARLFELAGDLKSSLQSAIQAKDSTSVRRVLKLLPPDEGKLILEKAAAYELLMEHYVEVGDFQSVAKLYERARQFDQAALAWERAGKLGNARKAFERARDPVGAQRAREMEVAELVNRGDRLGAAVLLLGDNRREEAVQVLLPLPPAKAFRFLQKVKLDEAAMALARREIQQSEAENKPSIKARWLEWTGDAMGAAEAWERAQRKDRALEMYEQVGQWQRAAQIAEALGRREKAIELYHRAGDKDGATRLTAPALPVSIEERSASAAAQDELKPT